MRLPALLLIACSLDCNLAQAATITFEGEVANQTCNASVNGHENPVVVLPTVNVNDFPSVGTVAGSTPFTLHLTGCAPFTDNDSVSVRLLGRAVTASGYLGNTATDPAARNVAIELLDADVGGSIPVHLADGEISAIPIFTSAGKTDASHEFAARYISIAHDVSAGKVVAVLEYTVSYL